MLNKKQREKQQAIERKAKKQSCKRCGKCCHRGDFWWASDHPLLVAIHLASDITCHEKGECLMLDSGNGCMIETYLGRDAKPDVCKEYDCEDKNDRKETALKRIIARNKRCPAREDKALRRLLANIQIAGLNVKYKNRKDCYPYI